MVRGLHFTDTTRLQERLWRVVFFPSLRHAPRRYLDGVRSRELESSCNYRDSRDRERGSYFLKGYDLTIYVEEKSSNTYGFWKLIHRFQIWVDIPVYFLNRIPSPDFIIINYLCWYRTMLIFISGNKTSVDSVFEIDCIRHEIYW